MITKVKYVYKDTLEVESIVELNKQFNATLKKAEQYNLDTENPLYISEVTKCYGDHQHTQILHFDIGVAKYVVKPHFKETTLLSGGDVFNNVYLIPLDEELAF